MILYEVNFWGIPLLLKNYGYGSAFPRAILFASISSGISAILHFLKVKGIKLAISNAFAYQMFAFVVGFALVFRSQLAYNRYWEARTTIQTMMGRLTYFTVETLACDVFAQAPKGAATPEAKRKTYEYFTSVTHKVSLLFALMLKGLRRDFNLDDIYEHHVWDTPVEIDASNQATSKQMILTFLSRVLALDEFIDLDTPGLPSEIPVIGGLSAVERELLMRPVGAPEMQDKGSRLQASRAQMVYTWIQRDFLNRMEDGGLRAVPPQVARLLNTLQEAMGAFGQATKLATTPFPFPWAQLVMANLFMLCITLPFVMAVYARHVWIAIMINFIVVFTFWTLNEVSAEMEDPYGTDPNDLPMQRYVFDFNQALTANTWQLRPDWFDEFDPGRKVSIEVAKPALVAQVSAKSASGTPRASWPALNEPDASRPGSVAAVRESAVEISSTSQMVIRSKSVGPEGVDPSVNSTTSLLRPGMGLSSM